jgi:hypothetical protein
MCRNMATSFLFFLISFFGRKGEKIWHTFFLKTNRQMVKIHPQKNFICDIENLAKFFQNKSKN